MSQHPHDHEQQVLRHVREQHDGQPSAQLDARILAAARAQAVTALPGWRQRLAGWFGKGAGRGRWSAALGCMAVLGLGLGLSLKTLQQVPDQSDAPSALMQYPAPAAPMLKRSAPPAPMTSAAAQMAEAQNVDEARQSARQIARIAPLDRQVIDSLEEIAALREQRRLEEAAERVRSLLQRHPGLDVEAELLRLPPR